MITTVYLVEIVYGVYAFSTLFCTTFRFPLSLKPRDHSLLRSNAGFYCMYKKGDTGYYINVGPSREG